MANLRDRDRAQVMLIAAFLLAASFVALALVLNSVIYTENIATRSEEARGSEAIFYKSDVVGGAEDIIEYENRNDTASYAVIEENYRRALRSMNNRTAIQHSVDGVLARTELDSVTEGRRIGQFNASDRNFTAHDGSEDWDLATNVQHTRAFSINVTDSDALQEESILDFDGSDAPFNITVSDGTDIWAVRIYQDDSVFTDATIVDIKGGGECTADPEPVIDISAGTIDGDDCADLNFGQGVTAPYTVRYEDAQMMAGNFSLVVESTSVDNSLSRYDSGTDTPFAFPAVYSSTLQVTYKSTSLLYETDATVVPGESDA